MGMRTGIDYRQIIGVLLIATLTGAACTEDVQLARTRSARTTSPPGPRDNAEDATPAVTRDEYCAGRGSPVAAELLAVANAAPDCLEPASRVFRYALCACSDAVFSGGLRTDAFDSSLAAYEPGQGGASLGVNGQLVATSSVELLGALTMTGTAPLPITASPFHVAGTLKTNGDLSITAADTHVGRDLWAHGEILAVAADASVAGDVYQTPEHTGASGIAVGGQLHSQAFELEPPCACAAQELLDIAAIVEQGQVRNDNGALGVQPEALYQTDSNSPLALDCGRFAFDGGTILGEARVVARGRSALFIHGDLAITGSFAPDLGSSGEMDVFVDGALVLATGAVLGSVERPAALRIYVGGEGDLVLVNPVTLAAGVYAPHATLYTTGEQASYGALFLAGYYATGDQSIHYDAALLHSSNDAQAQACGEVAGGCDSDADCEAPFVCQAAACSSRLE